MGLDELYQEIIFDHYKKPRNHGLLANPDVTIDGKNPFCGDEVKLSLKVENNLVTDIAFEGTGCAISQASVSIMTEQIKGKTVEQARQIVEQFSEMVKGESEYDQDSMDDLAAFQGVSGFPTRVKCALLGWNTLKKALDQAVNQHNNKGDV